MQDRILLLIKQRNEKGIRLLAETYFDELYLYCFRLIKSKEDSEDILQNIFIDLWENGHKKDISNLRPYLYQMLKYKVYDYWAKKKNIVEVVDDINEMLSINEGVSSLEYEELEKSLSVALDTLPPACKNIFELSRFEELTHDEISQRLDISKQTVKNQLSFALKQLKTLLVVR